MSLLSPRPWVPLLLRRFTLGYTSVPRTAALSLRDEDGRPRVVLPTAAVVRRRRGGSRRAEERDRQLHLDRLAAKAEAWIAELEVSEREAGRVVEAPDTDRYERAADDTHAYERDADPEAGPALEVEPVLKVEPVLEVEPTPRLQKALLLEAQSEAAIDGILVVSEDGCILSFNRRFVEMWGIPPEVMASQSDDAALQAVLDRLEDPEGFLGRVAYLYAHPEEEARDELLLRDGRVFDRYSAPVQSREGGHYGRVWFFRDATVQRRYADELKGAWREAEHARTRANHYAKDLEHELEVGRQIQQGFLPETLPEAPGWEIAARFYPARQVAGDFYDVFELPGGRIGIVMADVCGKGVGAALFMALFQSLLRFSAEHASAPPSGGAVSAEVILTEAIAATNGYITRVHRPAHTFASVFFGVLDPTSGALHYTNAGHLPPVVITADGLGAKLMPTGPALGLLASARFAVSRVELAPGEMLLAYTDGVTEARDAERAFFSEERLLALLAQPGTGAAALLDRVEQAVHDYIGSAALSDDLTLLAIRHGQTGE